MGGATSEGAILMTGTVGVMATVEVLATIADSAPGTEGGGCGGDGTWARMKGVHCGGQAPPQAKERDPELGRPRACE